VRIVGAISVAALLTLLTACSSPDQDRSVSDGIAAGTARRGTSDTASRAAGGRSKPVKRVFLTVDFQEGRTLRYKFTSRRNIAVDWDPNAVAGANRVQEQSESLEMIVAYTPVAVDPYGASTIRAVVESVQAVRHGGPGSRTYGRDAVETAQGKAFSLKVDPRGKTIDASELTALIQEMGKQAFRADTSQGRIKEPDMIGDFVASQWFLWDAPSSLERPAEGVVPGRTWPSQLWVPTPMVARLARNVVYQLQEVRQGTASSWRGRPALASRGHPGLASRVEGVPPSKRGQDARDTQGQDALATQGRDALATQGQDALATQGQDALATQGQDALATAGDAAGPLAVIRHTYTPADAVPAGWPIPYSGKFQVSGTFGFLGPYEALGLEGAGEELFNLQAGRIEQRRETYTLRLKAGLPPMGIKADPHITIEQTLSMELVNSKSESRHRERGEIDSQQTQKPNNPNF